MAMRQRFRFNTACHCEWYGGDVRCIATRVVSRKLPKYRSRLPLWRKQLNQLDHVTSHSVGLMVILVVYHPFKGENTEAVMFEISGFMWGSGL